MTWTDLNTVVYYGTSEDRKLIREYEFAYPVDRPDRPTGINQLYLKKCSSKKAGTGKGENPWMVDIVLTTPEMAIADDSNELTAIEWECLVVDEVRLDYGWTGLTCGDDTVPHLVCCLANRLIDSKTTRASWR